MRNFIDIVVGYLTESFTVGQKVLITDLYSKSELTDETELLSHLCPPINWDDELTIHMMSPQDAKDHITVNGRSQTLWDAYEEHASKAQKKIVNSKIKNFDDQRIVVLDGDQIVDGNHHVIAAIMLNKPVYYIDLSEWD